MDTHATFIFHWISYDDCRSLFPQTGLINTTTIYIFCDSFCFFYTRMYDFFLCCFIIIGLFEFDVIDWVYLHMRMDFILGGNIYRITKETEEVIFSSCFPVLVDIFFSVYIGRFGGSIHIFPFLLDSNELTILNNTGNRLGYDTESNHLLFFTYLPL